MNSLQNAPNRAYWKRIEEKTVNAVINVFLLTFLEKSTLTANAIAIAIAIAIAQAGDEVDLDKVENAKLIFRTMAIVWKKIMEQLKHVPCLVPPPNTVLHYEGTN